MFSPFYSKFKTAYICIHNIPHRCINLFALKLKTFFFKSTNLAYFFYAYVVQRLMSHIILSFCKKEMETIKKCAWNPGFATAHASSICLYFTIHLCKLLLKIFLEQIIINNLSIFLFLPWITIVLLAPLYLPNTFERCYYQYNNITRNECGLLFTICLCISTCTRRVWYHVKKNVWMFCIHWIQLIYYLKIGVCMYILEFIVISQVPYLIEPWEHHGHG